MSLTKSVKGLRIDHLKITKLIFLLSLPQLLLVASSQAVPNNNCKYGEFWLNNSCEECLTTCPVCSGYTGCKGCGSASALKANICVSCPKGQINCLVPNNLECQPHYTKTNTNCRPKCLD